MTLRARKSRWATLAVALTAAALCVPAAAWAADPGIGEYTLEGPDAGGEGHVGSAEPQARPEDLPPEVRKALAGDPDGKTLTKIATASELGAPEPRDSDSAPAGGDEKTSALTAAGNALDDPGSLALIAVVALIVLAILAVARRRRTSA